MGPPLNSGNLLGGMDPSGFNIKNDMMGLKNGISSHGMNGMIHSGINNHNHGLDSGNMVETATTVPAITTTGTTKSGKKKKIKPPKVKTVSESLCKSLQNCGIINNEISLGKETQTEAR